VSLALLGGHHVNIARDKGHLLAPALGALRFHGFMLGDCFGAFKLLPAFLATILVGRGLESSNGGGDVCRILRPMADVEKPIRNAVPLWNRIFGMMIGWRCYDLEGCITFERCQGLFNRWVAGSSPARGANVSKDIAYRLGAEIKLWLRSGYSESQTPEKQSGHLPLPTRAFSRRRGH
jgi:hypothetical protein